MPRHISALAGALLAFLLPIVAHAERRPAVERVPNYQWPASGAPDEGTWPRGAQVMDSDGVVWRCTTGGTPGTWSSEATTSALTAHLDDTTDAHDASAISVLDTADQYTATDVEAALAEVLDALQALTGTLTTGETGAAAVTAEDASLTYLAGPLLTVQAFLDAIDAALGTVAGNLSTHTGDTNNPHSVTAAQAGAIALSLATGADLFLYSTGASTWGVKTIAEVVTALDAATLTALADITGAALVGVDDTGLTYVDDTTLQGAVGDLDGAVATVAGDLSGHTGNTSNPHSVTAAQVGAFPLSAFTTSGEWIKATGAGTYALENAATTRSSLALATRSLYIAPGDGGVGTLFNMTASLPAWDATDRLPCITFTASADSATGQFGWSMILPAQFTAWGPTNVLTVALQFSDDTGNNAASLTCKGTDGATALDAISLTPSTSFGWVAVGTGSLEVGEAHAAGGIFSCLLSVTSDTADTIKFCGAYPTWTH